MTTSRYERALSVLMTQSELEDTTTDWYLNGERGHWHGGPHCRKLKRTAKPIQKTASFAYAMSRRVCGECFGEAADGLFASPTVARHVFTAARDYERAVDTLENNRSPIGLARAYRQSGMVLEDIDFVRQTLGNRAQNTNYLRRLEDKARNIQECARVNALKQEGHARSLLALSHMRPAYGSFSAPGMTPSEESLLGGDTHGHGWRVRGGKSPYQMWEETVETHLGAENRQELTKTDLAAVAEYVKSKALLTHMSQLDGISIDTPVQAGAILKDLAVAAWTTQKNDAVDALLERWTAALAALETQTNPKYLALMPEKFPPSDHLDLAILTWEVRRGANGAVLLKAPEVAAQWATHYQSSSSLSGDSRYAQSAEASDDPRVGETALSLWEPDTSGPYALFSECVRAATALLR